MRSLSKEAAVLGTLGLAGLLCYVAGSSGTPSLAPESTRPLPMTPADGEPPRAAVPAAAVREAAGPGEVSIVVRGLAGAEAVGLPGARVRVFVGDGSSRPGPAAPARLVQATATGPQGRAGFRPAGGGAQAWRVYADAPGFLGEGGEFRIDRDGGEWTLVLRPLGRIEGVVAGAGGGPLHGARVCAMLEGDLARFLGRLHPADRGREGAQSAATDRDGRFLLDAVPPGIPLRIAASHPEAPAESRDLEPLLDGETRTVRLALRASTRIAGSLPDDHPAGREASLTLYAVEQGGAVFRSEGLLLASEPGRFEFRNVRPGPKLVVYLRRSPGEQAVGFLSGTAFEGETVDVGTIDVAPTVLDLSVSTGEDLPARREALVGLDLLGPSGVGERFLPFSTRVDPNRSVRVRGIPAGALHLSSLLVLPGTQSPDPAFEAGHARIDFGGEGVAEVRLARRAAACSATAVLEFPEEAGEGGSPALLATRGGEFAAAVFASDPEDRSFDLRGLLPGDYEVQAVVGPLRSRAVSFRVRDGSPVRVLVRDWERVEGRIRGRALEAGGAAARARVVVTLEPGGHRVLETETDPLGRFEIGALFGRRDLGIQAIAGDGRRSAREPLEGRGGEGEIALRIEPTATPPLPRRDG